MGLHTLRTAGASSSSNDAVGITASASLGLLIDGDVVVDGDDGESVHFGL